MRRRCDRDGLWIAQPSCATSSPSSRAGISRELAWLLATAKLNQAERFGVGLGETWPQQRQRPARSRLPRAGGHYHTRLLAYVLEMFDLRTRRSPPLVMRQFVSSGVFAGRPGFSFVGAAEMAGCVLFDELRRAGVAIFADEPDVAARIDSLYSDILTDEIGHVGYCAARCTVPERALMRRLYPPRSPLRPSDLRESCSWSTGTVSMNASTVPST